MLDPINLGGQAQHLTQIPADAENFDQHDHAIDHRIGEIEFGEGRREQGGEPIDQDQKHDHADQIGGGAGHAVGLWG